MPHGAITQHRRPKRTPWRTRPPTDTRQLHYYLGSTCVAVTPQTWSLAPCHEVALVLPRDHLVTRDIVTRNGFCATKQIPRRGNKKKNHFTKCNVEELSGKEGRRPRGRPRGRSRGHRRDEILLSPRRGEHTSRARLLWRLLRYLFVCLMRPLIFLLQRF